MGELIPFQVDRFVVERQQPDSLSQLQLGCVEDRRIAEHMRQQPNAPASLYWQIAGGGDGIPRDFMLAMEVQASGSFIESGVAAKTMGSLALKTVRAAGIVPFIHTNCAAAASADAVNQRIIDSPDEVFEQTLAVDPGVTFSEFEAAHAGMQRIVDSGILLPAKTATEKLLEGDAKLQVPPVPHLRVVGDEHAAKDIVIDYGTDVLWDVDAAVAADAPAYYFGAGIYQQLHGAIAPYIPFEARSLRIAAAVRTATVSLFLPKIDGQDHTVHLRQAA